MQRFIDSPSALATERLELDTAEQLEKLTFGIYQVSITELTADTVPLRSVLDCGRRSVAAAWITYVCARNLLVIDGKRFTLDSTLGEIASALAVSVPENPNGTK